MRLCRAFVELSFLWCFYILLFYKTEEKILIESFKRETLNYFTILKQDIYASYASNLTATHAIILQPIHIFYKNWNSANYAIGDILLTFCYANSGHFLSAMKSDCSRKSVMGQSQVTRSLTDIPAEILLQILNQLSFMDLKNTESVSSYIR